MIQVQTPGAPSTNEGIPSWPDRIPSVKNGWHPVEVAAKRPRVQWGTPLPQCNHHLTNSEEIGENDSECGFRESE